ncbi:hypothetical protein WR25_10244 [Diploscapter pachys]|uniref:Uncharacterized protein n=1 Tax=Diploscapter pachys TaxID=2018661 RepID=A0A2A2KD13_9BILA|nr:hypothetical protein WR25_10244 [Diploscapter pachys]
MDTLRTKAEALLPVDDWLEPPCGRGGRGEWPPHRRAATAADGDAHENDNEADGDSKRRVCVFRLNPAIPERKLRTRL